MSTMPDLVSTIQHLGRHETLPLTGAYLLAVQETKPPKLTLAEALRQISDSRLNYCIWYRYDIDTFYVRNSGPKDNGDFYQWCALDWRF